MKATPEILRSRLIYDPETGVLTWRPRPLDGFARRRSGLAWNTRYAGAAAFTASLNGYRVGLVDRVLHYAHRVAWAITFGDAPEQIDHINGDKADNRIANLRAATALENAQNKGARPGRRFKGVVRVGAHWQARTNVRGVRAVVGRFHSEEEAARAYDEAAYAAHGEFARLNFPEYAGLRGK